MTKYLDEEILQFQEGCDSELKFLLEECNFKRSECTMSSFEFGFKYIRSDIVITILQEFGGIIYIDIVNLSADDVDEKRILKELGQFRSRLSKCKSEDSKINRKILNFISEILKEELCN